MEGNKNQELLDTQKQIETTNELIKNNEKVVGMEDVVEFAKAKLLKLEEKVASILKTNESEISQSENQGGNQKEIIKRTQGVDKKIEEVQTDIVKAIEEVKNDKVEVVSSIEIDNEKSEVNIENKNAILLDRWQKDYDMHMKDTFINRKGQVDRKEEDSLKKFKESKIDSVQWSSLDSLSGNLKISKKELIQYLPELYKIVPDSESKFYTKTLTSELVNQNEKDRYDSLDIIMQNTSKPTLEKMMQEDSIFGQLVGQMNNVYGNEIGKLIEKTSNPIPAMNSDQDIKNVLNYMASAGRFIEKDSVNEITKEMVQRLISNPNSYRQFQDINYVNLCEAGFTEEALKIISSGIEKGIINKNVPMKLKNEGYLNDEQLGSLALVENTRDVSREKISKEEAEKEITILKERLDVAEKHTIQNPNAEVYIEEYGIGKGLAKDLINKYRENIERDLNYRLDITKRAESNLKRLEITE